jgi:hypothetical protein
MQIIGIKYGRKPCDWKLWGAEFADGFAGGLWGAEKPVAGLDASRRVLSCTI